MSLATWTIEQVHGLAQDQTIVGAAETVADPAKWTRLGRFEGGIWGEFPNRDRPAHRTLISLPNMALSCDCPSRKYPCRHTLGLALIAVRSPQILRLSRAPLWVLNLQESSADVAPPAAATGQDEFQIQLLIAQHGLDAYSKWLRDMVHAGLADLPKKPAAYWVTMANRLADNGLYKLAQEVRQLPALTKVPKPNQSKLLLQGLQLTRSTSMKPNESGNADNEWPTQMLQRIGRHYLIAQAFKRYHHFSRAARADLRYAAGWFADPGDDWYEIIQDRWTVLGCRQELHENENIHHAWLWGEDSRRFALLSRPFPRADTTFQPFVLGATAEAELAFYPGSWPFRASLRALQAFAGGSGQLLPTTSILQADRRFRQILSANPWLDVYPQLLKEFQVLNAEDQWFLLDDDGYRWPLPGDYVYGWHLAAIMGQEGALLFGEWNGRFFSPLSFFESGRWQPMQILRGIK